MTNSVTSRKITHCTVCSLGPKYDDVGADTKPTEKKTKIVSCFRQDAVGNVNLIGDANITLSCSSSSSFFQITPHPTNVIFAEDPREFAEV